VRFFFGVATSSLHPRSLLAPFSFQFHVYGFPMRSTTLPLCYILQLTCIVVSFIICSQHSLFQSDLGPRARRMKLLRVIFSIIHTGEYIYLKSLMKEVAWVSCVVTTQTRNINNHRQKEERPEL